MIEIVGIAAAHFEEVIVITGDVVTFADLLEFLDAAQKRGAVAMAGERDGNVGRERVADGSGIEKNGVAANDSLLFEFAYAVGGGWSGEAEKLAEFGPGGAALAG